MISVAYQSVRVIEGGKRCDCGKVSTLWLFKKDKPKMCYACAVTLQRDHDKLGKGKPVLNDEMISPSVRIPREKDCAQED